MPPSAVAEAVSDGGGAGPVRRREVLLSAAGLTIVIFTLLLSRVNATLLLITPSDDSIAFPDVEASFARRISGTGMVGLLAAANSSNGCTPLQVVDAKQANFPYFVLIERGDCNFLTKVQFSQDAGYAAAIVFDNEESHDLITMSGNGFGIEIPAVFVSKEAGFFLLQFANDKDARVYMLPALETSAWSILAVSSISLLTLSAVLSTFFCVRRQRLRRDSLWLLQESMGLSSSEIKALPVVTVNQKENMGAETCAICLEENAHGDKLRMLPCNHGFHVLCIDNWLNRRPFCPICKRDACGHGVEMNSSEHAPLLNSSMFHRLGSSSSVASSALSSSSGTSILHVETSTNESSPVSGSLGDVC